MADANVTLPHAPSQPSPHVKCADQHAAWWAEYARLEVEGARYPNGEAFNRLQEQQQELLEQIATTPAATIAGVLAQLRMVKLGLEVGKGTFDATAVQSAIASLERLAGEE